MHKPGNGRCIYSGKYNKGISAEKDNEPGKKKYDQCTPIPKMERNLKQNLEPSNRIQRRKREKQVEKLIKRERNTIIKSIQREIQEKINKNAPFAVTFVVLTATFKTTLLPNI